MPSAERGWPVVDHGAASRTALGIAKAGIAEHLSDVAREARGFGAPGALRARVVRCALREAALAGDRDELGPLYALAALRELEQSR